MISTASPVYARRRPRATAVALGVAGVVAALLVSGCGSSSVTGIIDPVAKAATASTAAPGYRMTMTMQMTSPALPAPLTASGSGSFDVRDRAGAFTMSMRFPNLPQLKQVLGSDSMQIKEVLKGLTVYLHMPAVLASRLPGAKPWIKVDLAKQAAAMGMSGLSSFGSPMSSDPSQFLQYLRAVSGRVTKVGIATVAGYKTTQYRATIDLSKVANRVPAANRAAVARSIASLESMTHLKQLPVNVWIDGNHLVRRLVLNMNMTVTQGQSMAMAMQMTIPHYGPEPAPSAPPASQVSDISALQSAATGSASSSSSSVSGF
jgi:hypothetical protein